MGQRANSGRNASLDQKKSRAAGRAQNDPARAAMKDRQSTPPVGGATGGKKTHADTGGVGVSGMAFENIGASKRRARKQ